MTTRKNRIDPEPITIFMAVMAGYGASVASINFIKTHLKPLPTKMRNRVLSNINKIDALIQEIKIDLDTIQRIFQKAGLHQNQTIRLGNGVYLSYDDFNLYMHVSNNIFSTLKNIHSLCLKLERNASGYDALEMNNVTNKLGTAYEIYEMLRTSRDLTIGRAWEGLDKLATLIQTSCDSIRDQLQ